MEYFKALVSGKSIVKYTKLRLVTYTIHGNDINCINAATPFEEIRVHVGVSQWVRVKLGKAEHANYFGGLGHGPKKN